MQVRNSAMEVIKKLKPRNKITPSSNDPKKKGYRFKILHEEEEKQNSDGIDYHPVEINKFRFHTVKVGDHNLQPKLVSFHDIVTISDRFKEDHFKEMYVGYLLDCSWFRVLIMAVIIINSIVIAIQTDRYLETNYGNVFVALDKIFLTIYIIEILVKWYYDFILFWRVGWNVFDFIIVAASLLGPSLTSLSGGKVLRILRVLRALRSLRSISALRGLQIVVHTVMHSIPDMANIVALLLICMFIFAVLGVSFFGEKCPKYFGSLGSAMFSLFICITQDGWMGIREDLKSCGNDVFGSIYLLIFITIGAFIFANLVVAVVVTNLEWAIAEQKEGEKKSKVKHNKEEENHSMTLRTDDPSGILPLIAGHQEPLIIPDINPSIRSLEIYYLILTQIEENLVEFKQLREKLVDIVQEVKLLSQLEEGSSESDIGSIKRIGSSVSKSRMMAATSRTLRETSARKTSIFQGDVISALISMNRRHTVDSAAVNNINTLLHQLHSSHTFRHLVSSTQHDD